uniref:Uncharacterized protein n=1 Tax=Molossus molossus TaxID=27622 RepID=A0A7J8FRY8_MOLMO|nr:hypothetical protein HJG59_008389 [Molossus molossus]
MQPSWIPILEVTPLLCQCGPVVEYQPKHQEVASSIPSQSTCPGCGPNTQHSSCRRRPIDVLSHGCFYLSLSFPLSLKKKMVVTPSSSEPLQLSHSIITPCSELTVHNIFLLLNYKFPEAQGPVLDNPVAPVWPSTSAFT